MYKAHACKAKTAATPLLWDTKLSSRLFVAKIQHMPPSLLLSSSGEQGLGCYQLLSDGSQARGFSPANCLNPADTIIYYQASDSPLECGLTRV